VNNTGAGATIKQKRETKLLKLLEWSLTHLKQARGLSEAQALYRVAKDDLGPYLKNEYNVSDSVSFDRLYN
jgi:hypothetical protein